MKSKNFSLPRSCGAGREIGKAKLAERDSHDPCCGLGAPLASNNGDASEKRNVLWDDASLCVGLAHAEPRRHREHMAQPIAQKTVLLLGGVGPRGGLDHSALRTVESSSAT